MHRFHIQIQMKWQRHCGRFCPIKYFIYHSMSISYFSLWTTFPSISTSKLATRRRNAISTATSCRTVCARFETVCFYVTLELYFFVFGVARTETADKRIVQHAHVKRQVLSFNDTRTTAKKKRVNSLVFHTTCNSIFNSKLEFRHEFGGRRREGACANWQKTNDKFRAS